MNVIEYFFKFLKVSYFFYPKKTNLEISKFSIEQDKQAD